MNSERTLLESDYARTLLPVARMWRQAADRALGGMEISAAAGWALIQLWRLGDDVRQIDLARDLEIAGPSLVRLIDQMVVFGLVERHSDESDGRVSRVRMTERGRANIITIEATLSKLRSELLAGVSDSDLATALAVARQLDAMLSRSRTIG